MSKASNTCLATIATLSLAFAGVLVSFETVHAEEKTAATAAADTKSEAKTDAKAEAKSDKKADKTAKKGEKSVKPVVLIETSKGNIEVELWADKAPVTVENFLKYVDKGHYAGTIFHRVIPNFMIQGGGMTADMKEKPTDKPIKNEATNGASNKRGTLAMARTMVVDSATAQFFINVTDNNFLDHRSKDPQGYGYAVFGEVKNGMETVDAIRQVKTGSKGPHDDVPTEAVTIISIKRK